MRRYDGDTDSRFPQLTILEADSDTPMGIINWYFLNSKKPFFYSSFILGSCLLQVQNLFNFPGTPSTPLPWTTPTTSSRGTTRGWPARFGTIFNKELFGKSEVGNEIDCKWICLKISQMVVGSDIQLFSGGPRPLGKKRIQEQCQATKATYGWQQYHLPANWCWSLKDKSSL